MRVFVREHAWMKSPTARSMERHLSFPDRSIVRLPPPPSVPNPGLPRRFGTSRPTRGPARSSSRICTDGKTRRPISRTTRGEARGVRRRGRVPGAHRSSSDRSPSRPPRRLVRRRRLAPAPTEEEWGLRVSVVCFSRGTDSEFTAFSGPPRWLLEIRVARRRPVRARSEASSAHVRVLHPPGTSRARAETRHGQETQGPDDRGRSRQRRLCRGARGAQSRGGGARGRQGAARGQGGRGRGRGRRGRRRGPLRRLRRQRRRATSSRSRISSRRWC